MTRILCICVCLAALCADADAQNIEIGRQKSSEQIDRWIEQLDSSSFSDRVAASLHLSRSGTAAISHLERAAGDGSTEAADRAMEILQGHFEGEDAVLTEAAREALQRIADSEEHAKSSVAREILEPPMPRETRPQLPPAPMFPIQPQAANRQIRIQVKIVNGDRDVTVVENGKKIRVIENANGISVEKPDGKGGVKQSKYKNVEELKKKDAEAHEAYKRATGNGQGQFGIQIQGGIGQGFPAIPGLQFPPKPRELPNQQQRLRDRHEQLQETIKKQKEQIEMMRRDRIERLEQLRRQRPQPPLPKKKEVKTPDLNDVVSIRVL